MNQTAQLRFQSAQLELEYCCKINKCT